jgi:protein-tyrosine phosphatase
MIDTHCHLLPDLDDGPRSEGEALELARGLAGSGVTFVLCTPHYSRRFPTDHDEAVGRARSLEAALAREEPSIDTGLAAEVSPQLAISADPDELLARGISRRFLLVELLPDTAAVSLATIGTRLAELDLLPIFAHPERCRALRRHPRALDEARAAGALVQVVATSLVGRWGTGIAEAAWRLVDTGRADLIASDAHRPGHGSDLREAAELVFDRLGEIPRRELTVTRPGLALQGIHPEEANRVR